MHNSPSTTELVVDVDEQSIKEKYELSVDKESSKSTGDASSDSSQDVDPWDIVDQEDTQKKWAELTVIGKIVRVLWIIARITIILGLLYFFVCSLDILQDAFQLLGGRSAGNLFASSLINNPVCGLMIGVLVTVLVQSSSTSTSIIVSMVGSGLLNVMQAIPIIMGANIGTTVTNTLVALTQSTDRSTFRRAFAGATVHDMFNWLTVLILLPLESATHYLYHMTEEMTKDVSHSENADNPQFLKVITVPLTKLIIEVDKKVITAIAEQTDRRKFPLVKYYCKEKTVGYAINYNSTDVNSTAVDLLNGEMFSYNVKLTNQTNENMTYWTRLSWTEINDTASTKCTHLFVGSALPGSALSEAAVGGILLAGSLIVMVVCLVMMVKILNSLLAGPMAKLVRRTINADFPGIFAPLTGYAAMLVGAGVTVLVQSSSVFTSALTPLVGIGVVTVERVYPMTLGSNIGTTVTSILAALTADANMVKYTLQIALCHLFFNISGILIWYPIPVMRRVPIKLAKRLGNTTATYRWFAIFYLIVLYLLFPLVVFALSVAGFWVLIGVGIPIVVLIIVVVVINVIQTKRPNWLPEVLRTWDFLPRALRSLGPYDHALTVCFRSACYQKYCKCKSCSQKSDDVTSGESVNHSTVNDKYCVMSECVVDAKSVTVAMVDVSKTSYVNEAFGNADEFRSSSL